MDTQEVGYTEFINDVKKVNNTRIYKIKNSYGVYDAFKYYRKNKSKDKKYVLSESEYFSIIRKTNNYLAKLLSEGESIELPYKMGSIELRKYPVVIKIDEHTNKIKTNLPVDWNATLKLWYEDKECHIDKILIRSDRKELFKVVYNKKYANYNNKVFYEFVVNRKLKLEIKNNIQENNLDAFNIK